MTIRKFSQSDCNQTWLCVMSDLFVLSLHSEASRSVESLLAILSRTCLIVVKLNWRVLDFSCAFPEAMSVSWAFREMISWAFLTTLWGFVRFAFQNCQAQRAHTTFAKHGVNSAHSPLWAGMGFWYLCCLQGPKEPNSVSWFGRRHKRLTRSFSLVRIGKCHGGRAKFEIHFVRSWHHFQTNCRWNCRWRSSTILYPTRTSSNIVSVTEFSRWEILLIIHCQWKSSLASSAPSQQLESAVIFVPFSAPSVARLVIWMVDCFVSNLP